LNKRLIAIFAASLFFLNLSIPLVEAAPKSPVSSAWSYATTGKTFSPPAAANKMVYFYSNEGVVYAIDGLNGKPKWKYEVEPEPKEELGGCVTVKGGKAYTVLNDGSLIALNAFSGQEEWKYVAAAGKTYPPLAQIYYYTSPAVSDDNLVYLTAPDGTLHALNKDGKQRWIYKPGNSFISSPPAVFENTVYVGAIDGTVFALKKSTGEPIWTFKCNDGIFFAPVIFNGTLFVGSSDNKIYALDTKDGKLKWNYNIGNDASSSPAIFGNTVYIGSSNGELIALDVEGGELKWTFYAEGFMINSPIVDDAVLYVGSNDGKLYALDSATGDIYWAYDTEGSFVTSATFAKEMVYVGANVKKEGKTNLDVLAFKKGLSTGVLIRVMGRKGNASVKKSVGQIAEAADYILSDFGDKSIKNIATWPLGLILRFVEQNKAKQVEFAGTSEVEKKASKVILRYTPAASVAGYLCASMMTPVAPIMVLASVLCSWAILILIFFYGVFGKEKSAAVTALFTKNDTKAHSTRGGYLKALKYTLTDYMPVAINFIAGGLVLLVSWAMVDYFYPVYAAWLLYFLIGLMWLSVLFIGSFTRVFGLAWALRRAGASHQQGDEIDKPFKVAKRAFGGAVLLSGWYIVLLFLSAFCLGLAQTMSSYLAFILAFIFILLSMFTFFADAFVVFENESFPKAILRSIKLFLHHPFKLGVYIIIMGLIFILASLIIFGLLKVPFSYLVALIVCAVVSAYLTELHCVIFLKIVE